MLQGLECWAVLRSVVLYAGLGPQPRVARPSVQWRRTVGDLVRLEGIVLHNEI